MTKGSNFDVVIDNGAKSTSMKFGTGFENELEGCNAVFSDDG